MRAGTSPPLVESIVGGSPAEMPEVPEVPEVLAPVELSAAALVTAESDMVSELREGILALLG